MRVSPSLIASTICVALVCTGSVRAAGPKAAAPAAAAATAPLSPAGEGRRAYLKYNCYGCHGPRAAGGMGPNIQHAESGDLSEAVLEGEDGGMPSYSRIVTATDIANLGAYLRSIGTTSEPRFNDWWLPVPPK
jgi:mono/diheme cytochrome c family protein